MKTLLTSLVILLLTMVSCKENPVERTSSHYFPLEIGNEWIYEFFGDTTETLNQTVTGTMIINKLNYYILVSSNYNGTNIVGKVDTFYIRNADGMKFYEYRPSGETLYLDFSDNITDSVYIHTYKTEDLAFFDLKIGRFSNCKLVEDFAFARDGGSSRIYAKGVGLIRIGWFRGELQLKSAKINGKKY